MSIEVVTDNEGNKILKIYDNEGNVVSEQVTKVVAEKDVPMPKKRAKIVQIDNSKFWLPNYKDDFIQKCLLNSKQYFGKSELEIMSSYLNENSVVVDIGANIGNHSLYFANEAKVKKVYSYEPIPYTFGILTKNIKINHLENKIEAHCLGLSDTITNGFIKMYDLKNLGGTHIEHSSDGNLKIVTLDSLNIKEKIDLIKIDVEGMDYKVLCGAEKTIKKNIPVIEIESFSDSKPNVDTLMESFGYKIEHEFNNVKEYIYVPV